MDSVHKVITQFKPALSYRWVVRDTPCVCVCVQRWRWGDTQMWQHCSHISTSVSNHDHFQIRVRPEGPCYMQCLPSSVSDTTSHVWDKISFPLHICTYTESNQILCTNTNLINWFSSHLSSTQTSKRCPPPVTMVMGVIPRICWSIQCCTGCT